MAVPKKRKSRRKSRQVKAGKKKLVIGQAQPCVNCGAPSLAHRICTACGYYNGRIYQLSGTASGEEANTSE